MAQSPVRLRRISPSRAAIFLATDNGCSQREAIRYENRRMRIRQQHNKLALRLLSHLLARTSMRFMIKLDSLCANEMRISETPADSDEKLLLIDDASFVSAFVKASERRGNSVVCVRCSIQHRTLGAVVLMLDGSEMTGECVGSIGLCRECYRDLTELMFHDAVLRAGKPA
jgi:hypothetical protein